MISCKLRAVAAIAVVSVCALAVQALAGPDKLAFPEAYTKGTVWLTVDKDRFKSVDDIYAMPEAFDAARKGLPMPSGTVFVIVRYAAKRDAQGNPIKGPEGRFIKDKLISYQVMEKQTGWGADYPADKRNGEWEYRVFQADKTPNTKVNLGACFGCHKPLAAQDFVQRYDELKTAKQ